MAGHLLQNCPVYNGGLNYRIRLSSNISSSRWTLALLTVYGWLVVHVASLPAPAAPLMQAPAAAPEWHPSHGPQTCQRIDVASLCTEEMNNYKVPYNYTSIPNLTGQQDITEAVASLEGFRLLVRSACAPQLKFFLCSVYLPMCQPIPDTNLVVVVPPCRPLCTEVRTKCEPVLAAFQYPWPSQINCDDFPEENLSDNMCMSGPTTDTDSDTDTDPEIEPFNGVLAPPPPDTNNDIITSVVTSGPGIVARCSLRRGQPEAAFVYINTTQHCALSCTANYITSKEEKFYAEIFHGLVVGLTFLGTLFVALLIVCGKRVREQERPIFIILACLLLQAVGYAIRLAVGRQIGCLDTPDGKGSVLVGVGMDIDLPPWPCLLVFILLFYFGLAGNIWWLVLTVAWFLSAVRGSKPDNIAGHFTRCHMFVWCVPAILAGAGLAGKYIDADELTAICYVGQQNSSILLFLVLGPVFLITLIGSAVLLTGCIQLTKRRRSSAGKKETLLGGKSSCTKPAASPAVPSPSATAQQDDKLFALCVLFLPSSAILIGCYFAEYLCRDEEGAQQHPDRIQVALYFVRVVMQFIYGLVVAVWFCATAKRAKPAKNILPVQTTYIPPVQLNGGQLKVMENSYDFEEEVESDFYDSVAAAGPFPPSPSLQTVSTHYPILKLNDQRLVETMWKQQKLVKQELCKESMRSMPVSSCPSYI